MLDDCSKKLRRETVEKLLRSHRKGDFKRSLFKNEKVFTVQKFNWQNDRIMLGHLSWLKLMLHQSYEAITPPLNGLVGDIMERSILHSFLWERIKKPTPKSIVKPCSSQSRSPRMKLYSRGKMGLHVGFHFCPQGQSHTNLVGTECIRLHLHEWLDLCEFRSQPPWLRTVRSTRGDGPAANLTSLWS